jgi:HD-GYP domain-containing protein (c-di-GMP phosphodiesterase class II)
MRLFWTLLLLMGVASVIPAAVVGTIAVSETRELLVRDAQELAQERVKQLRLETRALLDEPTRAAVALGRVPGFFELSLAEQQTHLGALLTQRRDITAVTVFDSEGVRIPRLQAFALRDVPPTELADHEAHAASLLPTAELRYSEVYWSPSRAEPVLTLVFPMGNPVQGHIAAELSLRALARMAERESRGQARVAFLVDAAGRLVAGAGGMKAGTPLHERPSVAHMRATFADTPLTDAFHVGHFGQKDAQVVGAWASLPDVGWALMAEQPIELAYSQVATMRHKVLLAVGIAIVVALLLTFAFSRQVSRPIKRFTQGALELARGKFGVQVEARQKNEFGELARTFNYMSSQLQAYDEENRRLYQSLEQGYLDTIVALANAIDSKDAYTRGHSQRVGDISVEIGRELGLTERELKWLHYGGILHDVGKIGIIETILCKQTSLTDEEMVIMRAHPEIGDTMVASIQFLGPVRAAIRSHHERWDGKGYPDKLKGVEIPVAARIVNAADTFDACTSTRPYQKAMPLAQAMEIMEKLRGSQLDPDVVDALRRVVEKRGFKQEGPGPSVKLAS